MKPGAAVTLFATLKEYDVPLQSADRGSEAIIGNGTTLDFKKAEAAKPERRPEETASKMEPMAHHDMRPGSKFVTTFLRNEDD